MKNLKERARAIYLSDERKHDPKFSDEGSQFEYLWRYYQGYKLSNPYMAKMTVMASWERRARWQLWR